MNLIPTKHSAASLPGSPYQYQALFFAILLGVLASMVLVIGAQVHPLVAIAVCLAPLAVPFCLNPRALVLLTIFALIVLEEFPSGMGETAERAVRTPFYATSLGLPGLYPPDMLIIGAIALLVIEMIVKRQPLNLPNDRIQYALMLMMLTIGFCAIFSLITGNPFKPISGVDTQTFYKVNNRGLALIALFQFKNCALIFFAYVMGVFYFKSKKDFDNLALTFFIAMILCVGIGFARALLDPSIIMHRHPLFYHSPSTWLFALAVFFFVLQWSEGKLTGMKLYTRIGLSICLMIFILFSFRRTMWGAIALSSLILPFFIDRSNRPRYLMLLALGIGCGLVGAALIPGLLSAIVSRISETNSSDPSTLYRLALFVWFSQNADQVPIFGYGLKPLWDIIASLGYFRTNLENIHSLYFWTFLRTGFFGITMFAISGLLIAKQILSARHNRRYQIYHKEISLVFIAILMLLFSGIFNPVYAEIRYQVLTGFALAFISRLPLLLPNTQAFFSNQNQGQASIK